MKTLDVIMSTNLICMIFFYLSVKFNDYNNVKKFKTNKCN